MNVFERKSDPRILNNLSSDLVDIKTVENDFTIEQSIARRKNILKRTCRYLNGIIGVWISGSIHDLIHLHELLMSSTNSDDNLEAFLSSFEALQVENIMDSVKTNLVRWVTSEQIGKMLLTMRFKPRFQANKTMVKHFY